MIENLSILWTLRKQIKEEKPLIHCITNPISIHDCANIIIAAGARPIMAEHPGEVADITKTAKALMLNLGNITDARMEAMPVSLKKANDSGIPVLLDLVGISCSKLRFDFAKKLLGGGKISVLKGNMSELLTISGLPSHCIGIDAGEEDRITKDNLGQISSAFRKIAKEMDTVIMATGKRDLITDGERTFLVSNGTERLSQITGTGCQAGALTAAFLPGKNPLMAALLGTLTIGISGQRAAQLSKGPGSFQTELLDAVYGMNDRELLDKALIEEVK